jgi:hypothetical protein
VFTTPAVDAAYRATAARPGDPAGLLADNGAVFTGRYRGHGEDVSRPHRPARRSVFRAAIANHATDPGPSEEGFTRAI